MFNVNIKMYYQSIVLYTIYVNQNVNQIQRKLKKILKGLLCLADLWLWHNKCISYMPEENDFFIIFRDLSGLDPNLSRFCWWGVSEFL